MTKTNIAKLCEALNWRLLSGSHDFPGPDGGTCINEAAIVVAGLPYRAVQSTDDLPECFSPVIGSYTIQLNDMMPQALRQELLLPYVARLSGTADWTPVEYKRAELIVARVVQTVYSDLLGCLGFAHEARVCLMAPPERRAIHAAVQQSVFTVTIQELDKRCSPAYANRIRDVLGAMRLATGALMHCNTMKAGFARGPLIEAIRQTCLVLDGAARGTNRTYYGGHGDRVRPTWTTAVSILGEALAIGNQARPIDAADVLRRAATMKREGEALEAKHAF